MFSFIGLVHDITFVVGLINDMLFQNKRILLLIQDCNSDVNNSNSCIYNKELNLFNENVLTKLASFF